jgi:hypothetical protein
METKDAIPEACPASEHIKDDNSRRKSSIEGYGGYLRYNTIIFTLKADLPVQIARRCVDIQLGGVG